MLVDYEKRESDNTVHVETPVEIESKKYSSKKLEQLINLQGFGIRLVNKGEYEDIMKSGEFRSAEVAVFERKTDSDFQKYLASFNTYKNNPYLWVDKIQQQTRWPDSRLNVLSYRTLIEVLHKSHEEAIAVEKNHTDRNIRKETMSVFREYLMQKRPWDIQTGRHDAQHSIFFPIESLQRLIDDRTQTRREKLRIKEEHIYIIQQFYTDLNYLNKPENLRALINTISYYPFLIIHSKKGQI